METAKLYLVIWGGYQVVVCANSEDDARKEALAGYEHKMYLAGVPDPSVISNVWLSAYCKELIAGDFESPSIIAFDDRWGE